MLSTGLDPTGDLIALLQIPWLVGSGWLPLSRTLLDLANPIPNYPLTSRNLLMPLVYRNIAAYKSWTSFHKTEPDAAS